MTIPSTTQRFEGDRIDRARGCGGFSFNSIQQPVDLLGRGIDSQVDVIDLVQRTIRVAIEIVPSVIDRVVVNRVDEMIVAAVADSIDIDGISMLASVGDRIAKATDFGQRATQLNDFRIGQTKLVSQFSCRQLRCVSQVGRQVTVAGVVIVMGRSVCQRIRSIGVGLSRGSGGTRERIGFCVEVRDPAFQTGRTGSQRVGLRVQFLQALGVLAMTLRMNTLVASGTRTMGQDHAATSGQGIA